jgi:hypothetical protein
MSRFAGSGSVSARPAIQERRVRLILPVMSELVEVGRSIRSARVVVAMREIWQVAAAARDDRGGNPFARRRVRRVYRLNRIEEP